MCDCCLTTTITTCKIFFVIYIITFLTLVTAIVSYNYWRRKGTRGPTSSAAGQSKVAITACAALWLMTRILYFAVSFFSFQNRVRSAQFTVCTLEILQNLPVLLMYICFVVFHRFLLRIWTVMIGKDTPQRRRCIDVYFWVFTSIYTIS